MANIYSSAKDVIAWLGYDQYSGLAAAYIPRMRASLRHSYGHVFADARYLLLILVRKSISDLAGFLPHGLKFKTLDQSWALYYLILCYWIRGWVTQEIALAKRVRILVAETEFDFAELEHEKTWGRFARPSNLRTIRGQC